MLADPAEPRRRLLGPEDLDALPADLARHASSLRAVTEWARHYLSRPHSELGRPGPVCPYVPTALRTGTFHLAVQPGAEPALPEVRRAVSGYRDWFTRLEPADGAQAQFKTILILFPEVPPEAAPGVIDATQDALKPSFVAAGLMIGQFHPLPPVDGGLWNPDFRPLRSPVPLLAIRHLVPSDLPFLTGRRQDLESYARRFGDRLPARQRDELAQALAAVA